jgi:aldehyde:ferredoxin oxidoreductase
MNGWTGRILHINLADRSARISEPDEALYHAFIGGKGIAGHFLMPHVKEEWHSESMPLIFAAGPLVGTPAPTSGRLTISSKSPLTGTVGDTSVGGGLGFEVKKAGLDAIIVSGKAADWTGIVVKDREVEFTDARELCTLPISKRAELLPGYGSTALIGPAAENGVLYANIMVDGHYAAGRNGLGLVMSGKRLGYLHVTGTGKVAIYDMVELMDARDEIFRMAKASPMIKGDLGLGNYGTAALFDLTHSRRMMPTDNFRGTYFEGAENINAYHYHQKFGYKKTGCKGCHILCKKKGNDGRSLPEYETMSHFHALINNRDMNQVLEANLICNEMGMDTISTAVTISCYMELAGRHDIGMPLTSLVRNIGLSRGIGEELKVGSYRYAKGKGHPEVSMSVKELEMPAYDPRGAYGMALAYATSTRGACHLRAYPISHEILRKPVATDRFTFSGKARIIKIQEDVNAMVDSLTACKFIFFCASLEEYARALHGATGFETTGHDLLKIGERIYYQDRIMNYLNGFSAEDDDLPPRFFTEPGTHGSGIRVEPINRQEFIKARSDYYKIRGLDEHGHPTEAKCGELGLTWKNW